MHYINGKPAKAGDIIIAKGDDGIPFTGVVVRTQAEAKTCNLVVAPLQDARRWVTASDAMLAADVFAPPAPEVVPVN